VLVDIRFARERRRLRMGRNREAHRDPALRRWIFRRAEQGIATIIRFSDKDMLTIFAPRFAAQRRTVSIRLRRTRKTAVVLAGAAERFCGAVQESRYR
jgi:hypothetical protein